MLGTPTRDRVAERRSATRQEILDAAWEMARESGLTQITLRDLARRVGMQAPSLYSHFASKNAIYDAMFAEAWQQCFEEITAVVAIAPRGRRAMLRRHALAFFDFSVRDLARHQLMNQRTIVGFEPSPESYAGAVAVLERFQAICATHGITRQRDIDLYVAIVGGLIDAQLANDPGGDRWRRLVTHAVDMFDQSLGD